MPIGNKMSALGEKGRTKYEHCTTIAEMKKVKENYQDDLFGNEWNYNLPLLKDGNNLFNGNKKLKKINADFSSLTKGDYIVAYTPLIDAELNLSKLTSTYLSFRNCDALKSIKIDMASLVKDNCTFINCSALSDININLPNLTQVDTMFGNCTSLTSFSIDVPKLSNGYRMFRGCSNLTTFNSSLPSLSSADGMFYGAKLNKQSALHIIDTIPTYTSGTHKIEIGLNANELDEIFIEEMKNSLIDKGWTPSFTWNGEAPRDNQPFIEQFDEEIILPEGYSRCEYLEDTGVQWINTEYVPTNNTGLWTLAKITSRSYDGYPLGSGINDTGISAPRLYPKHRAVMYNV